LCAITPRLRTGATLFRPLDGLKTTPLLTPGLRPEAANLYKRQGHSPSKNGDGVPEGHRPSAHRVAEPQTRIPACSKRLLYQIWHRSFSARTIASPILQPNAAENAGIFASGPLTRNFGRGCSLVSVSNRANSGRLFVAHTCAQPRKNLCSCVNPSISFALGLPFKDS
jgi:hypothetical protein